ncbi:cellulose biosynthesis protein CelD [Caulobacter sp. Root487D2Y]|uniref:GNAT family N-acetyltransferase n=1 Tax=Caulobacter sp. Root487D2Y TaxID=1736547 RepID=UPI000701B877|nr:GNAT family N-acetyltransferase [Caulobacter sp. Root487D2Y]KQY31036.1 cellulose biosynthesis protein CelD [Caulobacter sp. Root487D2Y]
MLDVETLHPRDLAEADVRLWREMAAAEPAFASPLLGPDFARAVGAVRDDARVAVIRRGGQTLGFLPHHRRPGAMARAIGSPLSDYHGLISRAEAGLDAAEVLRAADLTAYRYTGLIDPHGVFGRGERKTAHVIDLGGTDAEAYLEAVRAASPKKIKNWRRLDSKLEREMGTLELVAADRSREAFDQLIAWKREQLERTGVHDFLRPDWVRGLLLDLFQKQTGPFRGLMINLYAGGQLVAGHFGVRLDGVFHPWIASTSPAHGEWSPGQIFLMRAIAAMPGLGLRHYDLGPGHDHYKGAYALSQVQIGDGTATAATMAGRMAHSLDGVMALAGSRGAGPVGRLTRRMDAIASVELTLGGRMRGLVDAFANQAQRRGG